jgi:hypothetical protein
LFSTSPSSYSDIITLIEIGEKMEDLSIKTAKELKQYALDNNIEVGEAKTKTKLLSTIMNIDSEISSTKNDVVSALEPEVRANPISSSRSNEDGVVVSGGAERRSNPVKEDKKEDKSKVAVHSSKNLHWQGIGKLKPGYNILSKEDSDKWLTNKNVRLATPEEVATYYGKA